ncbi:hypothetical protein M885DRAFT_116621 [Pelagophyceae sp. CCMP2097]|nr:hypothetical protein M885DRAFT_116621 [Pelagophyceae sp. CCMP2097]
MANPYGNPMFNQWMGQQPMMGQPMNLGLPGMLPPPPMLATPAAPPAATWQVYSTPDGRQYWSDGFASKWEEPDEVKILREQAAAPPPAAALLVPPVVPAAVVAAVAAAAAAAAAEPAPTEVVAEIVQASGVEGGPEMPSVEAIQKAMADAQAAVEAEERRKKESHPTFKPKFVRDKKVKKQDDGPYDGKAAAQRFKDLLREEGVGAKDKWGETVPKLQAALAFLAVRSAGERKQAFAEYQTQLAASQRDEARLSAKRHKDAFLALLHETREITARSKWGDADEVLAATCDERYADLEDSRERQDVFTDYISELEGLEASEKKKRLQLKSSNFASLLDEVPQSAYFAAAGEKDSADWTRLKWSKVDEKVLRPKADSRYKALASEDRRREWHTFSESRHRDFSIRKKKLQALVLEALRGGALDGEVAVKDLVKSVFQDGAERSSDEPPEAGEVPREPDGKLPVRLALLDLRPGETDDARAWHKSKVVQNVFDDARQDFKAERKADKKRLKEACRKVALEGGLPTWLASVQNRCHADDVGWLQDMLANRPGNAKRFYDDAVSNAHADAAAQAKKEKRFAAVLADHLYRVDHVDTVWDAAKKLVCDDDAYDALSSADRKKCFEEHMAKLRALGAVVAAKRKHKLDDAEPGQA